MLFRLRRRGALCSSAYGGAERFVAQPVGGILLPEKESLPRRAGRMSSHLEVNENEITASA
jgi:hypothetical protein